MFLKIKRKKDDKISTKIAFFFYILMPFTFYTKNASSKILFIREHMSPSIIVKNIYCS